MFSETPGYKTLVISSTKVAAAKVCRELLSEVEANDYAKDDIFAIHLALDEAVVNAVKHGNSLDPEKKVTLKWRVTDEKFEISVTDTGDGFKPGELPDPRCGENLEKPSGRGVLLMRSYMDVVEFNDRGNCVHMVKYNSSKSETQQ